MTKQELQIILKDHKDWLNNNGGRKAFLREANLSWTDLREANLRGTNLSGANLSGANLRGTDLRGTNLREANLRGANLRGTDLSESNLREADLSGANLSGADLSEANLLTFQFQQHQAICTGERLIIGCEDYSLIEWAAMYEEIGKKAGYTDEQIKMYGIFINMCIEKEAS